MKSRTQVIRKSSNFILGQGTKDMHIPTGVHETIPDMTLGLKDLLERHSKGLEIPQFSPSYNDDDLPDFFKMDTDERLLYLQEVKQNVRHIRREMQQAEERSAMQNREKMAELKNNTEFDKTSEKTPKTEE